MVERPALTYDALLPLLAVGDDAATVEFLSGRDERERRPIGAQLSAAYRDWDGFRRVVPFEHLDTAAAAVVGTASLAELKRLRDLHKWGQYCSEATYLVILDRRPDWIDRWAEYAMDQQMRSSGRADHAWSFFRLLIRDGICVTPACDSYTLDMIGGIAEPPFEHRARWHRQRGSEENEIRRLPEEVAYYEQRSERTIAKVLDADPGLLDDEVWRLFRVRGRPSRMLHPSSQAMYPLSGEDWAATLVDLVDRERIDRVRLLRETLAAIGRNFPPTQLRWCIALYDRLQPTPTERGEHVQDYLHLLGSGEAPVPKFAVASLNAAEDAGVLDGVDLMASLDQVLITAPAVSARAALTLLDRVLTRAPDLAALGVATAVVGLSASQVAVQRTALRLVEKHWDAGSSAAAVEALVEQQGMVDTSLRPRIASLVAG